MNKLILIIICGLFASILLSCSSDSAPPLNMGVTVVHVPANQNFKVTWRLSSPVRALVFSRPTAFRSGQWAPGAESLKIEVLGNHDVIKSVEPTSEFSVTIPARVVSTAGDFQFISEYSDGGLVLYTGHLHAIPLTCKTAGLCTASEAEAQAKAGVATTYHVVPLGGSQAVVNAQSSTRTASFNETSNGRFVYFGKMPVTTRGGVSMIVDPNLPPWVQAEVETMLPEILELQGRRLGEKLPFNPVVFIPYREGQQRSSFYYSGAVVGQDLIVSLSGSRWKQRTDESREEFLKLLAHESFHFWNSSLYKSVDRSGGRWLNEGSADAIAYLTLRELGVIGPNRYMELQSEALNRCMVGLSFTSLPESTQPSTFRNYYECGAVIELMLHSALQNKESDLWAFWAKVFEETPEKGFYTHERFFELAGELSESRDLVLKMKEITDGKVRGDVSGSAQVESYFSRTLTSIGLQTSITDYDWPLWYRRMVGERVLTSAVEADCDKDGYFLSSPEGSPELVGNQWCRNLKGKVQITHIGSYKLWSEGVEAYDAARSLCSRESAFTLSSETEGELRLQCPKLPQRPRYIRLSPGQNTY